MPVYQNSGLTRQHIQKYCLHEQIFLNDDQYHSGTQKYPPGLQLLVVRLRRLQCRSQSIHLCPLIDTALCVLCFSTWYGIRISRVLQSEVQILLITNLKLLCVVWELSYLQSAKMPDGIPRHEILNSLSRIWSSAYTCKSHTKLLVEAKIITNNDTSRVNMSQAILTNRYSMSRYLFVSRRGLWKAFARHETAQSFHHISFSLLYAPSSGTWLRQSTQKAWTPCTT